jgi:hypothetical protein
MGSNPTPSKILQKPHVALNIVSEAFLRLNKNPCKNNVESKRNMEVWKK